MSQVESSCIEYIVAAFKAAIYEVFLSRISPPLEQRVHIPFFFVVHVYLAYCMCSKKFEGDFNKEPWKEPLCLVIINLDFVVLSLIYFSPRCFDLQDLTRKSVSNP